jgi:hypothetical protein
MPRSRSFRDSWLPEIVTTGFVKAGRLEMRNRKAVTEQLRRMRDCEVVITIEPRKAARSQPQNRWYWGCIIDLLSEHTGYSPEELHELLKAKFLPKKLAVCDGNGVIRGEFVIGGSTTKLNKNDFGEYCERIRQWAAETLDVVIPDPDAGALWPGAKPQRRKVA